MTERFHYTEEQRQALREDVFARLEAGVASIQDTDSFQRYLAVQAKFHNYSANNVALILAQKPDASAIASFRRWKELGRSVKRGERGIRILAPLFGKDAATGEQVVRGFIPVPVFDLSQTEGRPLPQPLTPLLLEGDGGGAFFDALLDYAQGCGVRVRLMRHALELGSLDANGDYSPRTNQIRLRPNPMRQMAKTLAHELSHFVHITVVGEESEHREERETVAEGSAYVVAHHFGLDTGAYSFPYIAHWTKNRERLGAQLGVIQKVSSAIIDGIALRREAQARAAQEGDQPPCSAG
jgi:hypothetical protein